MIDWAQNYATRAERMQASEIRELLKLLDQPDIISFAGGIPDPKLEHHAGGIRAAYKSRRDAMLRALDASMPQGVSWTRPEGGMFIWMTLPEGLDAAEILKTAIAEFRIAFVPGSAFFPDRSGRNTLRLSFSSTDEARITEGIRRLGELLRR